MRDSHNPISVEMVQSIKFTPRLLCSAAMQSEYKRPEAIACPSGYVCESLIFIDPHRND